MSRLLKNALEKERNHYLKKLNSLGEYNQDVLQRMTITELRNEYFYFFRKNKARFQNRPF
ncbi:MULTISPECIES: hypothetical protein [Bacillus]|uniref:Stress protein n=2 Tax=Bacillus TaxID=1386 RepID=A0AA90EBR3_9BACI|nr:MULTISPECIES: hypothetical protein [Bacillus]KUL16458.1 stress protein [Bacillus licheniformis LMG 6934]TWK21920.1 Stress response protein YkoL [Bacillus licheniformis]ARA85330.1 stress protein [Bacillus paralicheniformis]EWH23611.1 stress protein [Bacillus haynesii]KND08313.1 stress protein [Bacillus paralicheniformis]